VGDRVACAGAGYANHAELVSIPENLCVKLSADADFLKASYNTLGAIALQGVRQADLRIGESCSVIGLGLLGQLTCLILRASGVRVIGLDVSSKAVATCAAKCADHAFEMTDPTLLDSVRRVTLGIGSDAVIITAGTASTGPVNLAGKLLRKRGTVVIVGNVPTGFDREPDFYRKELALKMSCSYGPGRYDPAYEEKGLDYPAGYVRWTEKRNMQAFQDMVHTGSVNIDHMTTHRFPIDKAAAAYEMILNRTEDFLGIAIEYDPSKSASRSRVLFSVHRPSVAPDALGIGFIGAGSYAMSHLLPNIPRDGNVRLTGVATASGTSSRSVAEKFGFAYAASAPEEILEDPRTNTVFVATRHDSHAKYVLAALKARKHVFVEKPLCLTQPELEEIRDAWEIAKSNLMIGFNRRFSPLTQQIKQVFGDGPMSIIYRINAGAIPVDSWIQDRDLGGGRIIGEVCHFIDFTVYMAGSRPSRVYATCLQDPTLTNDTIAINLEFENGSIASICYFANGSKSLPKEYVEIYKGGAVARLMDYKEAEIISEGKRPRKLKLMSQDKGQAAMTKAFLSSIVGGHVSPIPTEQSLAVTSATLAVMESLRCSQACTVPAR